MALRNYLQKQSQATTKLLNVVIYDALQLEEDGKKPDATRLLDLATKVLPDSFGIFNVLARLKAEARDVEGARAAYQRSLAIEPVNGVALEGMAGLSQAPVNAPGK